MTSVQAFILSFCLSQGLEEPALVQQKEGKYLLFFLFVIIFYLHVLNTHHPGEGFLLLFRQSKNQGYKSNMNAFGALLINVPTTAIFLLQYVEHSNVILLFVYCFLRSDDT